MATYKPLASVSVEAFQWLGDPLSGYDMPGWINGGANIHAPTNGMLDITCYGGRSSAKSGDWIVRYADGSLGIIPDVLFRSYYDVAPVEAATQKQFEADAKAQSKAPALTAEQSAVRAAQTQAKITAENTSSPPKPGTMVNPSEQPATVLANYSAAAKR